MRMNFCNKKCLVIIIFILASILPAVGNASDFDSIRQRGVLRHLGIPYANFVTGHGDGLDVELMRRFAAFLGVEYRFVPSNWARVFDDLVGKHIVPDCRGVEISGHAEIRGDVIASGITILEWRRAVVNFSIPTFPTQVWCISRADFHSPPVKYSGDLSADIQRVKALMKGHRVLSKVNTCLAPELYGIDQRVGDPVDFPGGLNDMAPALLKGVAEMALLDVPDTLVALERWPGRFKVIGPISGEQRMAVAFRKDSPELLRLFNRFFNDLEKSGEYRRMVKKYYPAVFSYYDDFFKK